ncbi:T9SS type A sorting domain-containing protein [bacterium]|nr:MAG: T9SS type A sorting domain-containing protein [bacterium]
MKKVITLFAFIGGAMFAHSQNLSYTLTTKTGTYAELASPTVTTGDWKNPRTVTLGFDFRFFNKTYATAYVVPFLGLVNFTNASFYDEISVIGGALIKHSTLTSNFSYKIEGNSPNRIAKLQWKNGGFEADITNQAFFNLQIWLYEGSNIIEIRHGSSQGVTQDIFAQAPPSYKVQNETPDSSLYLKGSFSAPVFDLNPQTVTGLDAYPSEGTIYVLTPKGYAPGPNSTPERSKNIAVSLYPNPATGNQLMIESGSEITEVNISDIQGKILQTIQNVNQSQVNIEHNLKTGIYLVKVNTRESISTQKLIIN